MKINGNGNIEITKRMTVSLGIVIVIVMGAVYLASANITSSEKINGLDKKVEEIKQTMVPRTELEIQFEDIKEDLVYIKNKLDNLGS